MQNPDYLRHLSHDKIEGGNKHENRETFLGYEMIKAAESVPGSENKENEDRFEFFTGGAVVLDGISRPAGGHIAAEVAGAAIKELLDRLQEEADLKNTISTMEMALIDGNQAVLDYIKKNNPGDIGTTAAAIRFCRDTDGKERVVIAWAGDSRILRLRNGKLEILTLDDTIFNKSEDPKKALKQQNLLANQANPNEFLKKKYTDTDEPVDFNINNQLTNYLGKQNFKPTIKAYEVNPGDKYFILTDGFRNLTTDELQAIMTGDITENIYETNLKTYLWGYLESPSIGLAAYGDLKRELNLRETINCLMEAVKFRQNDGKEQARFKSGPDDATAIAIEVNHATET